MPASICAHTHMPAAGEEPGLGRPSGSAGPALGRQPGRAPLLASSAGLLHLAAVTKGTPASAPLFVL